MYPIKINESVSLVVPHSVLSELGSYKYTYESPYLLTVSWGKLGGSSLTITKDVSQSLWKIQFHICTDKTTYRKNLDWSTFNIANDWFELNKEFILENMK
jgi:hypothetical protein